MSDLTTPLGVKPPDANRKKRPYAVVAGSFSAILALLLVVWTLLVDDPFGGEPTVLSAIETSGSGQVGRKDMTVVGVKSGAGEILPPIGSDPLPGEEAGGSPGEETIAGAEGEAAGTTVTAPSASIKAVALSVVADPELIEETPHGPIPRVSDAGVRPIDAYARPSPGVVGTSPRIALIVGGLGLSQAGTQEAIRQLPPEVTLAFAPYGASLERWAAKARQDGHELLLQVPLEPYDYPDNDPGPHTLLTSLTAAKNIDRLHYLMSRFGTYVGAISYMGARFTAEGPALDPVMAEFTARGLLFVDEGTSSRSVAAAAAKAQATPFAAGDIVVDGIPAENDIAGRLAQLEQMARTRGVAVGTASALPVSVKLIGEWAKGLEARGITLVPITAAQRKP
ncbi:divergent polysaccharide deacetylase family protein [Chthonobacter albigriseus]|uniref:divergent polysaccharide deacetylase family protein n=1 Tax=Chthonobacter albigriseus TaxID=1683161 RepID=UPI0015EFADD5|nr:divergent polysaccharide deacetylase family protein [Chthonobacter albigriseus]